MTTNYLDATDAMKKLAYATWKASTIARVGAEQKMFFQGQVKAGVLEIGDPADYWARVAIQSVDQPQTTLRGVAGERRQTAYGILWVQMFFPLASNVAWRIGSQIAADMRKALSGETASGTVWFLNPRINENLPADATHHRLNVLADYQYDEIV